MHDLATRRCAVALLETGVSRREVARTLGVSDNSTYRWQTRLEPHVSGPRCFRCDAVTPHPQYTYLLGQYLGDGHIGRSGRTIALRIYCCDLTPWQQALVHDDPRPLIRGLIQSDGCRSLNTVHRDLPSGRRTYRYPRYFFSNMSADIRGIFTDALDEFVGRKR